MKIVLFYIVELFFGIFLFQSLLWINASEGIFRKIFYIPARKSSTNAVQFGGFPLAITSLVFLLVFLFWGPTYLDFQIERLDQKIMLTGIVCSFFIVLYGFLDDKFELRPIIKLLFQFSIVTAFSLIMSQLVYPSFSSLAFLIISFYGLGVLNGANLLDGLDTLTIKLSSVTLTLFMAFGLFLNNKLILAISGIALVSSWSFYPYNKKPAKIHLGEIGGPFLGMLYLTLSCLTFKSFSIGEYKPWHALFAVLIPLNLTLVELGVSFIRRVYNGKSPFKGDKFHIHHILHLYNKVEADTSASLMGMIYFLDSVATMTIAFFLSPVWGFSFQVASLLTIYYLVGKKYWKGQDTLNVSSKSLFDYIRKKDVMLLEASIFDEFEIEVLENLPDQELDSGDSSEESEGDEVA